MSESRIRQAIELEDEPAGEVPEAWELCGVTKPGELPLAMVYWATIRPGSRAAMGHSARVIARLTGYEGDWRRVPWHALTPEVVAWVLERAEAIGYRPPTLKRMSVIIWKIVRLAKRRGLYTDADAEALEETARRYTPQTWVPSAGRRLTMAECQQQIEGAGSERDRLLLMLGMIYGLRRGELCDLRVGDLDEVTGNLKVVGKGGKERFVPLPAGMVAELDGWRGKRGKGEPMFPAVKGKRIDRRVMWDVMQAARRAAGVAKWSPHDLRRTAVTQLLEAGHDPIMVARAVGHSRVDTTMIYDHRGPEQTRRAFAGVADRVAKRGGEER